MSINLTYNFKLESLKKIISRGGNVTQQSIKSVEILTIYLQLKTLQSSSSIFSNLLVCHKKFVVFAAFELKVNNADP